MKSESQFTIVEKEGQGALVLEMPEGILHFGLSTGTSLERSEEIADYLNLVIEDVTFKEVENVQPDLERLNEEQPVSEAVEHP